ncbi:unnamed protein product [Protopolystoma xenopodis]|uniref:Uncharacterized protein n=1 Tax=Protopolystoma xenopodis TaxID=117903 RepID=A0A3S5CVD6_9PLAT|nr:unnamed protein product [Protopolystoma xenopodis]
MCSDNPSGEENMNGNQANRVKVLSKAPPLPLSCTGATAVQVTRRLNPSTQSPPQDPEHDAEENRDANNPVKQ